MGSSNGTLLIGDIASLTGTPASTLRFWEEQGIIEPEKDYRNRYRRYTADDSCRFLFVKRYRSYGMPLSDVPGMLAAGIDERTARLESRRTALEAEIRRLEAARDALERHLRECRKARGLIGRFVREDFVSCRFLPCVERRGVLIDGRRTLSQDWLELLPAVDFAVLIDPERPSCGKPFTCQWGLGAGETAFSTLPQTARASAVLMPSRPCAATAVLRESARDFTEAEYGSLLSALNAWGGELAGPIFGRILEIDEGGDSPRYLILLFLPIKE